jgi:hypothetical protein
MKKYRKYNRLMKANANRIAILVSLFIIIVAHANAQEDKLFRYSEQLSDDCSAIF